METPSSTSSPKQSQSQPTKQIFILSGQSNMAGRGGVNRQKQWDGIVPPECRPNPSIIRLNSHLQWEPAHEPLHSDIDVKKTCGVGPGLSFANAIINPISGVVALVPCAVGGTAIDEWARGSHLYDNMVARAKTAVNDGEIKAVLWYQGESDTLSENVAKSYKAKMENLIHNLRADLQLPGLPFIQVAIASGEDKYMEKVREAQKAIDLPNVVCVDAKGMELSEDNLHLTTEAQVQLGLLLADAYLTHFALRPPSY